MTPVSQPEVTQLLLAWRSGDEAALERLVPLVHQELKRVAHRQMRRERANHTLQTTALVNEAYLRLVECQQVDWKSRAHFLALTSRLMRRILVDFARSRDSRKRGGEEQVVTLDEGLIGSPGRGQDLLALDAALATLSAEDDRKGRVVELRFFGGLSVDETAEVLETSRRTVLREWKLAKLYLMRELDGAAGGKD